MVPTETSRILLEEGSQELAWNHLAGDNGVFTRFGPVGVRQFGHDRDSVELGKREVDEVEPTLVGENAKKGVRDFGPERRAESRPRLLTDGECRLSNPKQLISPCEESTAVRF